MSRWAGAASIVSEGIRQDVRYLDAAGQQVFVSVFAASGSPDGTLAGTGLIICPGWGYESHDTMASCVALGRGVAGRRGTALLFDWPGQGDSTGDPRALTGTTLIDTAAAVLGWARQVHPTTRWAIAGWRFGAAVAAAVAAREDAAPVLLIDPVLDPVAYFDGLTKRARRASLGTAGTDWAFAHPLPGGLASSAAALDVAGAIRRHPARYTVVAPSEGPGSALPPDLPCAVVVAARRRHRRLAQLRPRRGGSVVTDSPVPVSGRAVTAPALADAALAVLEAAAR